MRENKADKQPDTGITKDSTQEFEQALAQKRSSGGVRYMLRLYVTGNTPKSTQAIVNIRSICDQHLRGRYELEIIDIYQQPISAQSDRILATPTLIKRLPPPLRTVVGDMSNTERVLLGLDLRQNA